ncbi:MAG: hypothetical protein ACK5AZ_22750 [Bryobacteraceae bacterium]
MLQLFGIPVCVAVIGLFCQAPLLHFHRDADTQHARIQHQGWLAKHGHFGGKPTGAGWMHDQGDEDAVFLSWLQSAAHAELESTAETVSIRVEPPPAPRVEYHPPAIPCAHDPPPVRQIPPRSPPVSHPLQ